LAEGELKVSAGEVAVVVIAVSWAVLTCFLVRALMRLATVQKQTVQVVSMLAERLEQRAERLEQCAEPQRMRDEDAAAPHPARFAVVPAEQGARPARVGAGLRGPVVKVAAFSHGVRRAMTDRNPRELERRLKAEMKADRAARRAYWGRVHQ